MDITDFYTHSSVLVVAGKGGVGKTTVSAALATLASRHGVSVLLVELDGRSGRSAALDHPGLSGDEVEVSVPGSGSSRTRSAPIRARTVTPNDALAEYLHDHGLRRVARHLAKSGTLEVMAAAVPGLRDVLVLGKIVQLERSATADLIVVDGPAAGHATTFFTSAHGLSDSSRAGPVRAQAADVVELLSDPARCQIVLVTLAEETPVNETVEMAFSLEDRVGIHLGPVIVNGLYPRVGGLDADPEHAAAAAGVTLCPGQADAMRAAATFRRGREEMQAKQTARLAGALPLPLPLLRIPHLFTGEIGRPEIEVLADALQSALVELREPPRRAGGTGSMGPAAADPALGRAGAGPVSSS